MRKRCTSIYIARGCVLGHMRSQKGLHNPNAGMARNKYIKN